MGIQNIPGGKLKINLLILIAQDPVEVILHETILKVEKYVSSNKYLNKVVNYNY